MTNTTIGNNDKDRLNRLIFHFFNVFNAAFFEACPISQPVIAFEENRHKTLGHYPVQAMDSDVKHDAIIYRINPHYPEWEILTIILHCMVHSWQINRGKKIVTWFHDREFKNKMRSCGILCDDTGRHLIMREPFISLMKKEGFELPHHSGNPRKIRIETENRKNGKSKLKKWSCGCTNARVAVINFQAECLKCGNRFQLRA